MNWNEAVWLYCERGTASGLLAEPLNALSTLGFLLAAGAALLFYRRLPLAQRSADHLVLIALTMVTGLGALSFHLYANQASELAHMLPFVLLMLVYFQTALVRLLALPPGGAAFLGALYLSFTLAGLTMSCPFADAPLQPDWSRGIGGATSCLNGSAGYLPTLLALAGLAIVLHRRYHKAASSVWLATALFGGAVLFHALDHFLCGVFSLFGPALGTHFLWHLLTAAMVFVLLRSLMLHQNKGPVHVPVQEIIPPYRSRPIYRWRSKKR